MAHANPSPLKCLNFLEQGFGIDDNPIADDRSLVWPKDSCRDELEDEFRPFDHHRVSGICAALIAGHDIEMLRQRVDDFSLPLITLLNAHNNNVVRHTYLSVSNCTRLPRTILT